MVTQTMRLCVKPPSTLPTVGTKVTVEIRKERICSGAADGRRLGPGVVVQLGLHATETVVASGGKTSWCLSSKQEQTGFSSVSFGEVSP
jgi:hypothetical protein